MRLGWDVRLDDLSHKLPLPQPMQRRICDWLDVRLGVTPEELAMANGYRDSARADLAEATAWEPTLMDGIDE